jgi:hypothetical protein
MDKGYRSRIECYFLAIARITRIKWREILVTCANVGSGGKVLDNNRARDENQVLGGICGNKPPEAVPETVLLKIRY